MAVSLPQAKELIADEMNGNGDRSAGWDGRLTAAILVVFGDGEAAVGRQRLADMAALRIKHSNTK